MDQLADFVEKAQKLPECGLILSTDVDTIVAELNQKNFIQAQQITDINSNSNYFVLLNKQNAKIWYDFSSLFPTGEIQYTSENTEKNLSLNPIGTSVIFISNEVESLDPDIRKVTGLTISI